MGRGTGGQYQGDGAVKCMMCDPGACHPAWLYVVADERNGLVKIGCTRDATKRLARYRANGCTWFRMAYRAQAGGCEFKAWRKEAAAIKRLDPSHRVRGDWFAVPEAVAVAAVRAELERAGA